MTPALTKVNDFPVYWLAAKALLHGQSPYLPVAGHTLNSLLHPGELLVPLNPPWALPIILPLGWLPFRVAEFAWLVLSILLIAIATDWLRALYLPEWKPTAAWIVAFTFLPTLTLLVWGQFSAFLLFGIAGFLRYESKRPFLAGAFLFFAAVKPHLVFLIWPALLLCAVVTKRWNPLAGFAATISASSALMLILRPGVFAEYLAMVRAHQVTNYGANTLATWMMQTSPYLQYLPFILALVFFTFQWRRFGASWGWPDQMPLLVLVSLVGVTYAWFLDEVVLFPAIFDGIRRAKQNGKLAISAAIYFGANLAVLGLSIAEKRIVSLWIPLLWLGLYGWIASGPVLARFADKRQFPGVNARPSVERI